MFYFDEAEEPFQSDAAKIRDVSEFGAPSTKQLPTGGFKFTQKKTASQGRLEKGGHTVGVDVDTLSGKSRYAERFGKVSQQSVRHQLAVSGHLFGSANRFSYIHKRLFPTNY